VNQEHLALVAKHLAAENEHRMAETLETLHPDCVFEDVAMGKIYRGRAGAEEYYRRWWTAFDFKVQGKKRHFTEEGVLIAETSYLGKHVGDFFGLPPTQQPIELRLCVIIGFRDGLMDGERFYYDLAGLLRQLGVTTVPQLG
jgi:steroid delta-isomerase-like uncharacterized protein